MVDLLHALPALRRLMRALPALWRLMRALPALWRLMRRWFGRAGCCCGWEVLGGLVIAPFMRAALGGLR